MDNLVKTQSIHVSSREAGDNPSAYDVNLPREGIVCEDDEILVISLQSFKCFLDTHLVNAANNAFAINGISIILPVGTYAFRALVAAINSLYGSRVCSWNKQRNSLVFQSPVAMTIDVGNASDTLGFPPGTHTGTYLEGGALDPMRRLANVVVHLDGLSPHRCFNLNNHGGFCDPTSALHVIPLDAAPFSWFNYEPTMASGMIVNDKNIQALRVRFTDLHGEQLDGLLPHHSLILHMSTHLKRDEDESLGVLKQIAHLSRMQLLTKHLKK